MSIKFWSPKTLNGTFLSSQIKICSNFINQSSHNSGSISCTITKNCSTDNNFMKDEKYSKTNIVFWSPKTLNGTFLSSQIEICSNFIKEFQLQQHQLDTKSVHKLSKNGGKHILQESCKACATINQRGQKDLIRITGDWTLMTILANFQH